MQEKNKIIKNGEAENPDQSLKDFLKGHAGSPFNIPEGYFDELQLSIERKVADSRPLPNRTQKRFPQTLTWFSIAAGIILLAGIFLLLSNEKEKVNDQKISNILKKQEMKSLAIADSGRDSFQNHTQMNRATTAEKMVVEGESIQSSPTEYSRFIPTTEEEITEEDIINYLIDENFEITDLTN